MHLRGLKVMNQKTALFVVKNKREWLEIRETVV